MARVSPALALLCLLGACQEGTPRTSRSTHLSSVPTVSEVARSTTLTIFARENHSTANTDYHTVLNEYVMSHPGACANKDGHGGRWRMGWTAMCERQQAAACQESYPVVSDETRTPVVTWRGVNAHSHSIVDWASCGRWTWGTSWEGADYGDCQTKGEVIPMSGTGQERATVAAGIGYAAKHAEDQIVVSPAIFISAEGPGGAAGLEFSYREQSWGNGFEVRCQYKCDWASSSEEVVLMEKCWQVGVEDSDELSNLYTDAADLTYDGTWRELKREKCTEDDGNGGDDEGGDDTDDDDGTPTQDAGGGGSQDGGAGGSQDGGSGGGQDGGAGGGQDGGAGSADAAPPTPTGDAGSPAPIFDAGPGGEDGGASGGQDGGAGGGQDGGAGGGQDGGTSSPPDGGPWPQDAGHPHDAGAPQDAGHPRDGGPTPRDGGLHPHDTEPVEPTEP